jgi:putative oxidoreductase
MKRDLGLLAFRLTVGGYLAVHGAQKLFGAFDGPGLDRTGAYFETIGLKPGKAMAALAGGSEFAGGLLTAAGLASPVGPIAIAGAMAVAASVHLDHGPMGQKGGYELPAVDLAAVTALAATGPGRYSLDHLFGLRPPKGLVRLIFLGTAGLSGYCVAAVLRTKKEKAAAASAPTPAAAVPSDNGATAEVGTDAEGAAI